MKTLLKIKFAIVVLALYSCANSVKSPTPVTGKKDYIYRDKAGTYSFQRESGPVAKERSLYAVKQVLTGQALNGQSEIMERSVVVSREGTIKGKMRIWRPEKSEYAVWFDGKEYSTKMQLDEKNRALKVVNIDPELKEPKENLVRLSDSKTVYCFFSQIIECAQALDFINKSIENGNGQMNFNVIWEGYPYFQQQYVGLPEEVFSRAQLSYDGENERKIRRFSLNIGNQVIFYQLNTANEIVAIFWPAQGMSVGDTGSED